MVERHYFAGDIVRNRISGEYGEITVSNSPDKEAWVKVSDSETPGTFKWHFDNIEMVKSVESREAEEKERREREHNPAQNVSVETVHVDERHFEEHSMDLKQALFDTVRRVEKELIDRQIMHVEPSIMIDVSIIDSKECQLVFTVSDDDKHNVTSHDPETAIQEFIRRVKWDDENNPDSNEN